MKSDVITWPKDRNGNWTEGEILPAAGHYCGLILLVSTRNAEPLAFINDGVLQHMRVAGGAGIGAKYLSRTDSHVVGMLGSGGMARAYLEAFKCVRDVSLCKVFSPTPAHRELFAREMSKRLAIEVLAVADPREAVRGADILASCTDSMQPVYVADWIEKGMHVTNLAAAKCPTRPWRFDVVVRQSTAGLDEVDRALSGRAGSFPAAFMGGTADEIKNSRAAARFRRRQPIHGSQGGDGRFRRSGDRQARAAPAATRSRFIAVKPGFAVLIGRLRLRRR
jgi:alanine dehydrogenase